MLTTEKRGFGSCAFIMAQDMRSPLRGGVGALVKDANKG